MHLLIKGIAVGLSIAGPVGTIGFLCIQETLSGGILLGIASGLGAATADMMYGIVIALGLKAVQLVLLRYQIPFTFLGGLFLCCLGIRKFLSTPSLTDAQPISGGLWKAYGITFFLTLTNPATTLEFIALFAGFNIDITNHTESLKFVGGVFIGSALWWILLCCTVGLLKKRISTQTLRYINNSAAIALFSFGIYALIQLL